MGLNWFSFAGEDDVRAHRLYEDLIEAKASGYSWDDTWVRVKRRDVGHVRVAFDRREDYLWTGLEWVPCFTYDLGDRLYVRLPRRDELS